MSRLSKAKPVIVVTSLKDCPPDHCVLRFNNTYNRSLCRHIDNACFSFPRDADGTPIDCYCSEETCTQCAVQVLKGMVPEEGRSNIPLTEDQFEMMMHFFLFLGKGSMKRILPYFLQSKKILHIFMHCIFVCLMSDTYAVEEQLLLEYLGLLLLLVGRKRRWVRRFIECGDGKYFNSFVIHHRSGWEASILWHMARHNNYYLALASKKKSRLIGLIRENYQWIERTMCISSSIGDAHLRQLQELKENVTTALKIKDRMICDNRDCDRMYYDNKQIVFKRCKRCRMMKYCSRHCQKVDWNRHNHRLLCFQYKD